MYLNADPKIELKDDTQTTQGLKANNGTCSRNIEGEVLHT